MNNVFDSKGKIPSGIWVLGFVSMLMDVSSEMIHSLLPMFLAPRAARILRVNNLYRTPPVIV